MHESEHALDKGLGSILSRCRLGEGGSDAVSERDGEWAKRRWGDRAIRRWGMTGENLPDRWGEELGASRTWFARSANRGAFGPFPALAIAAALPNLSRTLSTTRVFL